MSKLYLHDNYSRVTIPVTCSKITIEGAVIDSIRVILQDSKSSIDFTVDRPNYSIVVDKRQVLKGRILSQDNGVVTIMDVDGKTHRSKYKELSYDTVRHHSMSVKWDDEANVIVSYSTKLLSWTPTVDVEVISNFEVLLTLNVAVKSQLLTPISGEGFFICDNQKFLASRLVVNSPMTVVAVHQHTVSFKRYVSIDLLRNKGYGIDTLLFRAPAQLPECRYGITDSNNHYKCHRPSYSKGDYIKIFDNSVETLEYKVEKTTSGNRNQIDINVRSKTKDLDIMVIEKADLIVPEPDEGPHKEGKLVWFFKLEKHNTDITIEYASTE